MENKKYDNVDVEMLQEALETLVILKDYKDLLGKTDNYEKRKTLAWEKARTSLNIMKDKY